MISVRDLLRRMRTHAIAAVVSAAGLATLMCGYFVLQAIGAVDVGAAGESGKVVAEELTAVQEALTGEAAAVRLQLETMRASVDALDADVGAGCEAAQRIHLALEEMSGADEETKEAFADLSGKLTLLDDEIAQVFEKMNRIEQMLADGTLSQEEGQEALREMMEELNDMLLMVVAHYETLCADVANLTDRLREYGGNATIFLDAVSKLERHLLEGAEKTELLAKELHESSNALKYALEEVMVRMDDAGDSVDSLAGRIEETNRNMEILTSEVTAVNENVGTVSGQLAQASNGIDALQGQLAENNRLLQEVREEIKAGGSGGGGESGGGGSGGGSGGGTGGGGGSYAAGGAYVLVPFQFDIGRSKSNYTFDFSTQLANYTEINSTHILVRSFSASAAGQTGNYVGIGATINIDNASYDPVTGHLAVTSKLLNTPFGSQKGSVTFAVLGGVLAE